jgi:hypothetical protein
MAARECMFYHEDCCLGKCENGESFECPGMVENGVIFECHGKDSDLVTLCEMCECREADAGFPYDEYCKECAEEMKKTED